MPDTDDVRSTVDDPPTPASPPGTVVEHSTSNAPRSSEETTDEWRAEHPVEGEAAQSIPEDTTDRVRQAHAEEADRDRDARKAAPAHPKGETKGDPKK